MSEQPVRSCAKCFQVLQTLSPTASPDRLRIPRPASSIAARQDRGDPAEGSFFVSAGKTGWSNGFTSDTSSTAPSPVAKAGSSGGKKTAASQSDPVRKTSEPSIASRTGSSNPAQRLILGSAENDTGDVDPLERKFHALALQAKLEHPGTPFQQSIPEMYEFILRQGISPEEWPSFLENRLAA